MAKLAAISFAPPTCPDKIGIINFPFSSIHITAGSKNLSLINGDIALIAIPVAPTKIRALLVIKFSFVQSLKLSISLVISSFSSMNFL